MEYDEELITPLNDAMRHEDLIGLELKMIVERFEGNPIYGINENLILIIDKRGPILCEFKNNKCINAVWMPVFDLNKAKEAILKNEKQRKSLHGLSRKEIIALFPGRNIQDIENGIDIVLNEGILTCLFQNGKCVDASLTPNMEESTFNQSNKRGIENDPLSELLNFEIWNYLNNKNKETN